MSDSIHTKVAVSVEGLSRSFRGKAALSDVNLLIPEGSVFGLVGLNGAGKTTLIRHLMGLLKAKHGTVRVFGQNPVESPDKLLKRVGYMTEEDSLPKWMRVGDMLDFSRAIYPSWDNAYCVELCDMFGLTRTAKLSEMSKGQRARVGLLIAIAHRPELLILDEPSSGLDPIARSDILEAIIRTVSEDGRTVLFSSHLLDEVDRVCDSVALMLNGTIIESITVEKLESRYSEIICRPNESWAHAPSVPGVFGWKSSVDEWSAVVDDTALKDRSQLDALPITQTRDISLLRWFAARTGKVPVDDANESTANDAEEPSHV
ncbi:ABC transporter ATP-binding protein [Planctomycetes bacterium K23_9]|uniref:ABC transporter ATP-binding protein YtrB n=1 Tax=Stieleria marina TaxID=1930275 RepID=A0A517NVN1_9BACT|nr:ABC transporter ATP-binding protein YtrB [Planctomycetes bacterium K23_9]